MGKGVVCDGLLKREEVFHRQDHMHGDSGWVERA